MKIRKFDGGGFLGFTPIIGTVPTATQPQSNTQQSSTKSSLMDDETFKELTKGGLINDVNAFVGQLIDLENSQSDPFLNQNNRGTALRMIGKVNEIRQTKEMWDKSVAQAKDSGGLNEVAVGSYGEIYAKDAKNNVIALSLGDYAKQKDKVRALTVAELLNERQYNPNLTGINSVFNTANNSIGMNKITNQIKSLISAFGQEDITDTRVYSKDQVLKQIGTMTGKKPTAEEAHALKSLYDIASTPGDYYKVKTESSTERSHAEKAINYIWSTLGDSAQKKLQAESIINGTSPKQLILDMILVGTTEKHTQEIEPTKLAGSSDSEGKNEKSLSQFQMFFKNSLKGVWTDFMMNDPNIGTMFKGAVGSKGPLVDKNDENIGMEKLYDIMTKHQYNSMVDSSNMYFGNKKISAVDQNNIIFNNSEDAGIIFLPTKNGAPDYDSFKRYNDVNQIFEANKSKLTELQVKQLFAKYGFNVDVTRDEHGNKTVKTTQQGNVKPFLVMSAYTTDAVDSLVDGNNRLSKLTGDEEKSVVPYLDQAWTIGTGKTAKNLKPTGHWFTGGTDYYKGVVLAPVKLEGSVMADALSGQGPKQKTTSLGDVQYNIRNSNQSVTSGLSRVTSSSVIPNN